MRLVLMILGNNDDMKSTYLRSKFWYPINHLVLKFSLFSWKNVKIYQKTWCSFDAVLMQFWCSFDAVLKLHQSCITFHMKLHQNCIILMQFQNCIKTASKLHQKIISNSSKKYIISMRIWPHVQWFYFTISETCHHDAFNTATDSVLTRCLFVDRYCFPHVTHVIAMDIMWSHSPHDVHPLSHSLFCLINISTVSVDFTWDNMSSSCFHDCCNDSNILELLEINIFELPESHLWLQI